MATSLVKLQEITGTDELHILKCNVK